MSLTEEKDFSFNNLGEASDDGNEERRDRAQRLSLDGDLSDGAFARPRPVQRGPNANAQRRGSKSTGSNSRKGGKGRGRGDGEEDDEDDLSQDELLNFQTPDEDVPLSQFEVPTVEVEQGEGSSSSSTSFNHQQSKADTFHSVNRMTEIFRTVLEHKFSTAEQEYSHLPSHRIRLNFKVYIRMHACMHLWRETLIGVHLSTWTMK